MVDFSIVAGFDWDAGNARKNERHGVTQVEAEQVFIDPRLLTMGDEKHSVGEERFHAFGATEDGRLLHVAFTLRNKRSLLRVISARDMSRRERKYYESQD